MSVCTRRTGSSGPIPASAAADHLDTENAEATLAIQMRGIINEYQLADLRAKTLRGQHGQKARGFTVGEGTYGYCSKPVGPPRPSKGGRPRYDGYKAYILRSEAAVVRRIFDEFVAGVPKRKIVQRLNDDGVATPKRTTRGWTLSTISRILANTKYIGVWVWNKTGTKRNPTTGRRRAYTKPASEHVVTTEERLRIIPQELWDAARAQQERVTRAWPQGGRPGFSGKQGPRAAVYPKHLFDGMIRCGTCNARFLLVSGKRGGYYGCPNGVRHSCPNNLTVCRAKVERIFLRALAEEILQPSAVRYALCRVADEVAKVAGTVPDLLRSKRADLEKASRELVNLVHFVKSAHVSDSPALASEIRTVEARVARLDADVDQLAKEPDPLFTAPSESWLAKKLRKLQALLERRTPVSAQVLRGLLGDIRFERVQPETGRPYYVAHTSLDTVAIIDPPGPSGGPGGRSAGRADVGSGTLRWWTPEAQYPVPGLSCFDDRGEPSMHGMTAMTRMRGAQPNRLRS